MQLQFVQKQLGVIHSIFGIFFMLLIAVAGFFVLDTGIIGKIIGLFFFILCIFLIYVRFIRTTTLGTLTINQDKLIYLDITIAWEDIESIFVYKNMYVDGVSLKLWPNSGFHQSSSSLRKNFSKMDSLVGAGDITIYSKTLFHIDSMWLNELLNALLSADKKERSKILSQIII